MQAVTILITEGGMGFGHISIFLSESEGNKLKVSHRYGYYGVPSTSEPDSFIGRIKKARNVDLDLTGNHGMLIDEEIFWFDKGSGVHGVTIEIYPEQFKAIYEKCEAKKRQQYLAIAEIVPKLPHTDQKTNYKYYPQEKHSYQIFQRELERARENSEEPRLYPFGVKFSLSMDGLFKDSSNCKTGALAILKDIIAPEHLRRLTDNGAYPVRPGRSGPMEEILFHSSGPLSTRKTKQGVKQYRKNGTGANLYWTIPPQELIRLPVSSFPPLIEKELCAKMKATAKKLQALEEMLRNSTLTESESTKKLIEKIVYCYEAFSFIEDNQKEPRNVGLFDKNDLTTMRIKKNLLAAEQLLESVYLALTTAKQNIAANDPEIVLTFLSAQDREKMLSVVNPARDKRALARL